MFPFGFPVLCTFLSACLSLPVCFLACFNHHDTVALAFFTLSLSSAHRPISLSARPPPSALHPYRFRSLALRHLSSTFAPHLSYIGPVPQYNQQGRSRRQPRTRTPPLTYSLLVGLHLAAHIAWAPPFMVAMSKTSKSAEQAHRTARILSSVAATTIALSCGMLRP